MDTEIEQLKEKIALLEVENKDLRGKAYWHDKEDPFGMIDGKTKFESKSEELTAATYCWWVSDLDSDIVEYCIRVAEHRLDSKGEWLHAAINRFEDRFEGFLKISNEVRESKGGPDKKSLQRRYQSIDAMRTEIIATTLEVFYPDWQSDFKTDHFRNWLKGQTAKIKDLVSTESVKDLATLLGLYENFKAVKLLGRDTRVCQQ